jgi:hypothetical protein
MGVITAAGRSRVIRSRLIGKLRRDQVVQIAAQLMRGPCEDPMRVMDLGPAKSLFFKFGTALRCWHGLLASAPRVDNANRGG